MSLAPLRTTLWKIQNGRCHYCGRYVPEHEATLDHCVPRSLGGPDKAENAVMACLPCNRDKADMLEEEFRVKIATGSKRRRRVNPSDEAIRAAMLDRKMKGRRTLGKKMR